MALTISEENGKVVMKLRNPSERLATEEFKEVCAIAKKFGGDWNKLNGQWEIPITTQ
jgi:hypothetical protein